MTNPNQKSIVISVGHHKEKQGARCPITNISEWQINTLLSRSLQAYLKCYDFDVTLIPDAKLPHKVKLINLIHPDLAIDMHMNSFNKKAEGFESLYYFNSIQGERVSHILSSLNTAQVKRDIKPISLPTERGYYFLKNTVCPAIIMESGFIDVMHDLYWTVSHASFAHDLIAHKLHTYFKGLENDNVPEAV